MNETLPRVRAGQPVPDTGECWRHIAERQQAIMERDTVPGYVAGAVEAMDAGDPKPRRVAIPAPVGGDWVPFVVGVFVGAVACYAVLVMAP